MYPEAGGSSSFARRAFNEFWSFFAAWAQMLTYVITVAISAFFVPHYIGGLFWEPLRSSPGDIVAGAFVIVVLAIINVRGVKESTTLNVTLAVTDFLTQVLLVLVGGRARPLADDAGRQRPPRRRADVARLHPRDPDRDARLHRHRDDLEHGRGGQGRDEDDPDRDQPRAHRGVRDLLHAAGRRAVGAAGAARRGRRLLHAARPDRGGGRLRRRPDPRRRQADRPRPAAERRGDLRRPAGRDDPVPRHQRRADRRLAARLLDGHPPPAARPAAPAAPEVPDAVDRDPALLGDRDRHDPAGPGGLPRQPLRVRRAALVHVRARLGRAAAGEEEGRARGPTAGRAT